MPSRLSYSPRSCISPNITGSEPVVGINMIDTATKYSTRRPGNLNLATAYATHAVTNTDAVGIVRLSESELNSISPRLNSLNTSA